MRKNIVLQIIAAFLVILFLWSCKSAIRVNQEPTETLVSSSPTTKISKTPEPFLTASQTATQRPTRAFTPRSKTKPPTITPFPLKVYPTLEPNVYLQTFKIWQNNQDNCAFPCLWNIQPGKTTIDTVWNDVHEIFPNVVYDIEGGISYLFSNDFFTRGFGLPTTGIVVYTEDNTSTQIHIFGEYPNKSLNQIVNELGYPDEVYVSHLIGGEGYAESLFLLIFNKANTVVEFNKVIQVKNYETLNFCITADDYPNIDIYPEGKDIQLSDLSYNEVVPIKPFSEAVGQEFAEYYQENLSSDGTLCIVTSQKIW